MKLTVHPLTPERWPDLEAFYTSAGVVPVEAALPKPGGIFIFVCWMGLRVSRWCARCFSWASPRS